MSNTLDTLSDEEVRQIALLVETLDRSTFDYLQLDVGRLKLTLGKGAPIGVAGPGVAAPAAAPMQVAAPAPAVALAPAAAPGAARAADGSVEIVAPMLGRFYAKPEPGAAPFVAVGTEVSADTTVGLIEVKKVFTAVRAGLSGVVTEICVQDAQFIEYGHVLFRVRPTKSSTT